jgi:hypothetical protein
VTPQRHNLNAVNFRDAVKRMRTRPRLINNTKLDANEISNDYEHNANKGDSLELNTLVTIKNSNEIGDFVKEQPHD